MKYITVVAAIWQDSDGRYFLAQRHDHQSQGGFWEFPGGKVEPGETEPEALARELAEEIGIGAKVGNFLKETRYEYEPGRTIVLRSYRIDGVLGIPLALEHQAIAWVAAEELLNYDLAAADVALAKWLLAEKE